MEKDNVIDLDFERAIRRGGPVLDARTDEAVRRSFVRKLIRKTVVNPQDQGGLGMAKVLLVSHYGEEQGNKAAQEILQEEEQLHRLKQKINAARLPKWTNQTTKHPHLRIVKPK